MYSSNTYTQHLQRLVIFQSRTIMNIIPNICNCVTQQCYLLRCLRQQNDALNETYLFLFLFSQLFIHGMQIVVWKVQNYDIIICSIKITKKTMSFDLITYYGHAYHKAYVSMFHNISKTILPSKLTLLLLPATCLLWINFDSVAC